MDLLRTQSAEQGLGLGRVEGLLLDGRKPALKGLGGLARLSGDAVRVRQRHVHGGSKSIEA